MRSFAACGILSIVLCSTISEGSKLKFKESSDGQCWRVFGDNRVGLESCNGDVWTEFMEQGGDGYLNTTAGTKLESVARPGYCLARGIGGFQVQNLWYAKGAAIANPWCLHECSGQDCADSRYDAKTSRRNNVVLMDTCVGRSALWVNDGVWLKNLDSGYCLSTCTTEDCRAGPLLPADASNNARHGGYNVHTEKCSTLGSLYWGGGESTFSKGWWRFTTKNPGGNGEGCLDTCLDPTSGCNDLDGDDIGEVVKIGGRDARNVFTVKCGDYNAGENQVWTLIPQPLESGLVVLRCDDPLTNLWTLNGGKMEAVTGSLEKAEPCVTAVRSQLIVKDCAGQNAPDIEWVVDTLNENVVDEGKSPPAGRKRVPSSSKRQDNQGQIKAGKKPEAAYSTETQGEDTPFWENLKFRLGIVAASLAGVTLLTCCMICYFRNRGAKKPEPKTKSISAKATPEKLVIHNQAHPQQQNRNKKTQDLSDQEWMAVSFVPQNSGRSTPSSGQRSSGSGRPCSPLLTQQAYSEEEGGFPGRIVTAEELKCFKARCLHQIHNSTEPDCTNRDVGNDDVSRVLEKIGGLTEGWVFSGRYIMESKRCVGTGGVVCFARNQFNREAVAIKFYADRKSFQREREVHHLITSHNIVRLEDVIEGENGYPPAIVFERGDYTMEEWLRKSRPRPLSQKLALHQVLESLLELHQHHIIHGDLKPSNIMWFSHDHAWKLTDLGSWARAREPSPVSYTLMYGAPEVVAAHVQGKENVILETSADMWSFGIIAYEVTTGMRFYGLNTSSSEVLERLLGFSPLPGVEAVTEAQARRLVKSLVHREPQKRWTSTIALRNAFFRSAEDTKQQQETWGMVNAQLHRIEQITATTAKEVQAANMMVTILLDHLPDNIEDGSWTNAPADEVLMATDDELPDSPVFMLPISPKFRLRMAITHDHNLALQVSALHEIKVEVGDGEPVILQPEVTSASAGMVECVALWDPSEHSSRLLGVPTQTSGPLDKRVVGLEVSISLSINGLPPITLNGRLFCRMHKHGSNFTCRKIFRGMNQKWKDAPSWVKDGMRGAVLLMSVGASAAGLR
ncbi:hypothetical protein BSKO_00165 [Bryopsis sp. KO-2023]|nr:hypothetical protein BSKO_00165 [Bryopsis sp. KO-2023]